MSPTRRRGRSAISSPSRTSPRCANSRCAAPRRRSIRRCSTICAPMRSPATGRRASGSSSRSASCRAPRAWSARPSASPTRCARPGPRVYIETPRSLSFTRGGAQQLADDAAARGAARRQCRNVAGRECRSRASRPSSTEARATQLIVGKSRAVALVRAAPRLGGRPAGARDARSRGPCPAASSEVGEAVREVAPTAKPGSLGKPSRLSLAAVLVALVTASAVAVHAFGNLTNVALALPAAGDGRGEPLRLRTGVFTGVLSSLAYNFFFLPPIHTFTIQDPENVLTILVLHRRRDRDQPAGRARARAGRSRRQRSAGRTPRSPVSRGRSPAVDHAPGAGPDALRRSRPACSMSTPCCCCPPTEASS